MTPLYQQINELTSLTKLYLLRNYSLSNKRSVHPQNLDYFNSTSSLPIDIKVTPPIQKTPPQPFSDSTLTFSAPIKKLDEKAISLVNKEKLTAEKKDAISEINLYCEKTIENFSGSLKLEPVQITSSSVWQEKEFYQQLFPKLSLIEKPLSHTQKKCEFPKNPVIIFNSITQKDHAHFLENLSCAISLRFASTTVHTLSFSTEKIWQNIIDHPNLNLLMITRRQLHSLKELNHYFRECPKEGRCFLGSIPVILLLDFSHYAVNPAAKSALWRSISNEFTLMQSNST